MRFYFPVDSTGNLIMIEKLVLGEIWTGDLPIFNPDALISATSRQANKKIWDKNSCISLFCLASLIFRTLNEFNIHIIAHPKMDNLSFLI